MRRNERIELVQNVVTDHAPGEDVADAILDHDGVEALAAKLNNATDGSEQEIADRLIELLEDLDDDTADWFTGDTDTGNACDAPAAFLASRV